jgi:pantothenate kinase
MFRRRGAHFTFDAVSFGQFVTGLRNEVTSSPLPFPTFSHSLKDPVAEGGWIEAHHRIM